MVFPLAKWNKIKRRPQTGNLVILSVIYNHYQAISVSPALPLHHFHCARL